MTDPIGPRPDVSVVIVNYRSASLTLHALAAAAAAADGLGLQEIVADGGRADDADEATVLRLGRPGTEVLSLDENRGYAAGNNAAIARATGRHLLLVNPDAFAHADAVAQLVGHLDSEPSCGVVAPMLTFEGGRLQDNAYRRFPNLLTLFVDCCAPLAVLLRGRALDPHHVPRAVLAEAVSLPVAHATGAALLVRAEAAAAAGPLDESYFMYLEETEWQQRIAAAGWRIDVLPGAVFTHLGGGSSKSFPLASPHFLDSVEHYFRRPWLALAAMGAGALLSLAVLLPSRAVRLGGSRVKEHTEAMRRLLGQVTARLRHRAAARLRSGASQAT